MILRCEAEAAPTDRTSPGPSMLSRRNAAQAGRRSARGSPHAEHGNQGRGAPRILSHEEHRNEGVHPANR